MAKSSQGIGFECFSNAEEDVFLAMFATGSDSEDEVCGGDKSVKEEIVAVDVTFTPEPTAATESIYQSVLGEEDISMNNIDRLVQVSLIERKHLGIAHQLWPAAAFLCEYLHRNPHILFNNSTLPDELNKPKLSILELGAGIGLCGMFVAQLLRNTHDTTVVLTDLPAALDGINENIQFNALEGHVKTRVLSWGVKAELDAVLAELNSSSSKGEAPVVIAADCVYWECLYESLFHTFKDLIAVGCKVILSHMRRWKKDSKFFAMCRKAGWKVTMLHEAVRTVPAEHTGVPTRQVTRIYCIDKEL